MLGWIQSTIPNPPAKRAAAIGIINAMGNIGSIPGAYIYPSSYGPYYVKSFGAEFAILSFAVIIAFTLRTYLKSLNKKLDVEEQQETTQESTVSETQPMKSFRYLY
jgi:nitrate/nitrite transporter NarK